MNITAVEEIRIDFNVENQINYTNHRGEVAVRRIIPRYIVKGTTPHHPHTTWLLVAWDLDKGAERHFALSAIETRYHEVHK